MDTMIELPAMRRSAELAPNTADADTRTVEVVWSAGARVRRATFDSKLTFKSRIVWSLAANCSTIALNCRARTSISSLPVGCTRSVKQPCSTRFMASTSAATRNATERDKTVESASPIRTAAIEM